MKTKHTFIGIACIAAALVVSGCGPSKEEIEAQERERARLELERQAQEDAAKANKAITEMNKSMFSRMWACLEKVDTESGDFDI